MDDQRIGASLRSLRVRRRLRQVDAGAAAGIPRKVVILIEAGRLQGVRFGDIRRYAASLGARFDGSVLWQGADLDRMVNRGHARLHEALSRWLVAVGGWLAVPEVSFAFGRERGVIDMLAWHAATRTLLVIELKTRIVDINDLMTTMRSGLGLRTGSRAIALGSLGDRAVGRGRSCSHERPGPC